MLLQVNYNVERLKSVEKVPEEEKSVTFEAVEYQVNLSYQ